jgi:hypothetical protein
MGIDPKKVGYLALARGIGNLGESSFAQIGERVSTVRTDFGLINEWRQIHA